MGALTSSNGGYTRAAGDLGELLLPGTVSRHRDAHCYNLLCGLGFTQKSGGGQGKAYREERARREEAEATGKTERARSTGTDGRVLREASARVTDGLWYTENMSRFLPPPPGKTPPCLDPITAGGAPPWGALPERGAGDELAI
jgi:hypothetical protein